MSELQTSAEMSELQTSAEMSELQTSAEMSELQTSAGMSELADEQRNEWSISVNKQHWCYTDNFWLQELILRLSTDWVTAYTSYSKSGAETRKTVYIIIVLH